MWEKIKQILGANTPRDVQRLGAQSAQWLADESFDRALAEIRASIFETWRISRDPETRERSWVMMQALDTFVDALRIQMARSEFDRENEKRVERHEHALPRPE